MTILAMAAVSAAAAPPLCNIADYGAAAGGRTNNANAIQRAVDAWADAGGGTVYVPPGEFLSGNFVLKSNITLRLAPGARLVASPRIEDHCPLCECLKLSSYCNSTKPRAGSRCPSIALW